ncbi:hypothetical protein [Parvibaculum sp.]|uniref:hypothetical protein n=1 Tax=Parvibaculum sp. TaxID=2024848 RepID=UPI003297B6E4
MGVEIAGQGGGTRVVRRPAFVKPGKHEQRGKRALQRPAVTPDCQCPVHRHLVIDVGIVRAVWRAWMEMRVVGSE